MDDESKVTYIEGETEVRDSDGNIVEPRIMKPNIRTLRGIVSGMDDTSADFITVRRNDSHVQINKSQVVKIESGRMQE